MDKQIVPLGISDLERQILSKQALDLVKALEVISSKLLNHEDDALFLDAVLFGLQQTIFGNTLANILTKAIQTAKDAGKIPDKLEEKEKIGENEYPEIIHERDNETP